ncbi:MAG: hypothetical protein ABI846_10800 [Rudaea sp.]
MDTINSLLAPVSAAARHLSHALRRVQGDFQTQARKSGKVVRRDLGAARDELGEAVSRLGDATDHLRDSIATTKSEYTETLLDKYHAGADYARALRARANALTLPKLDIDRRYLTRNNALIAGAAIGVGYVLYRALRKLRSAAQVETVDTEADDVVRTPKSRRKARPAKAAKKSAATAANGVTAEPTRPH